MSKLVHCIICGNYGGVAYKHEQATIRGKRVWVTIKVGIKEGWVKLSRGYLCPIHAAITIAPLE